MPNKNPLNSGFHLYQAIACGNEEEVNQLLSLPSIPRLEEIKNAANEPSKDPLILAMSYPDIFKKILEAYANAQQISAMIKGTLLVKAASKGHEEIVTHLIQKYGTDISSDDKGKALWLAAKQGQIATVSLVLQYCSANISMDDKGEALHNAATKGHTAIVTCLLLEHSDTSISMDDKSYALTCAAEQGHTAIVIDLLKHCNAGISIEDKGNALKFAANGGHIKIVTHLIENCSNDIWSNDKSYALVSATKNDHKEIITYLLEHCDADINDHYKNYLLRCATEKGQTAIVALLLKYCSADDQGWALVYAAENGQTAIVNLLLQNCGVDISNINKFYALLGATHCGHVDALNALLANESVATIAHYENNQVLLDAQELANDTENEDERTCYEAIIARLMQIPAVALRYATEKGQTKIVALLLKCCSADDKNWALMYAAENGQTEIVSLLLKYCSADDKGWALMHAAEKGQTAIISLLLQNCGADISNINKFHALLGATHCGHVDALNALLENESVVAVAHYENNQVLLDAQELESDAENEDERTLYEAIIDRLMQIPAVAELDRQQPSQEVNLADIARYSENSVKKLDKNEKSLIKNLRSHYKSVLEDETWDDIRKEILSYLELKYEEYPAIDGYHYVWMLENDSEIPTDFIPADTIGIAPQGKSAILYWKGINNELHQQTVSMSDVKACYKKLDKMNWLEKNIRDASLVQEIVDKFGITPHPLQGEKCPLDYEEGQHESRLVAYYRHSVHNAWRYLSDENPWMSPNANFINYSERRASIGDLGTELISCFWIAIKDETVSLEPGFSIEGNKNIFIETIACINRGHNIDERALFLKDRESFNKEPDIKTTTADDLKADKPSCLWGVENRLLQSQYGHPYINAPEAKPLNLDILLKRMIEQLIRTKEEGAEFDNLIDKLNHCKNKIILDSIRQQIDEICHINQKTIVLTKEQEEQYESILSFPDEQIQTFMKKTMLWFGKERIEKEHDSEFSLYNNSDEILSKHHNSYKNFIEYCAKNPLHFFAVDINEAVTQCLKMLEALEILESSQPILNIYQDTVKHKCDERVFTEQYQDEVNKPTI